MWDNNLTAETNMARMGLRQSANRGVRPPAAMAAARSTPGGRLTRGCEVSRMFGESEGFLGGRFHFRAVGDFVGFYQSTSYHIITKVLYLVCIICIICIKYIPRSKYCKSVFGEVYPNIPG